MLGASRRALERRGEGWRLPCADRDGAVGGLELARCDLHRWTVALERDPASCEREHERRADGRRARSLVDGESPRDGPGGEALARCVDVEQDLGEAAVAGVSRAE